ncbi:4'-phosphopantetheinyl transferase family protein [Rehaibacterium terrae]|jgi:4'-phosphopantetheinyl transferase|uniref:4'-phosphopantetheinyl transferase n=1 Tax=Rehaibacterium terrae TaxID=1341696 RepID=A0A7W8DE49_9GAMM|nr:4'-phosphopantetheinyl transferase superfamily protein [Rehaibacterium terrae]MBB5015512.1 4'-phosphopantetheinyl transferase [Rehaibacterium terrae]
MHWQAADPHRPPVSLHGPLLHLWWWAPERQPALSSRRARIDALLRRTLAAYVGLPPEALRFGREAKGRPYLLHDGAPDFNLTDTDGGTLVAVCRGARVGVDIERTRRAVSARPLARRWFAPEEAAALDALDDAAARAAFLRLWTAKEASCKATGTGIYGWLAHWRFDPDSHAPRLLSAPTDAGVADEWSYLRLSPPGGAHTVALAARGTLPVATGFVATPE